jgi:steroid delta-isomerase-like uncharacterized protein
MRPCLLFAALWIGCGGGPGPTPSAPASAPSPTSSPAPDPLAIYQSWIAATNDGRWGEVGAALADDASLTPASSGMTLMGRDNIVEFFKSFAVGFPDLRTRPVVILSRPGHVTAVAMSSGTNSAAVGPLPASGRAVEFLGLTEIEFDDAGRITRIVVYADNLNFLAQMGQWQGTAREAAEADAGATPTLAVHGSGPREQQNVALANRLIEAFNGHDAPALLALYTPDALLDDQHLAAPIITAHQIATHHSDLFPAFPDIEMTDVHSFSAGDYVVLTYVLRGTHAGPYARLPGPPTYRQIELQGAALLTMRGDRIAEHLVFVDGMAMGFQLGLVALPGGEP